MLVNQAVLQRGIHLNPGMQRNLESFIVMKLKDEVFRETAQRRRSDSKDQQQDDSQVSHKSREICKELTKWLQSNRNEIVEDLQPSHPSYNLRNKPSFRVRNSLSNRSNNRRPVTSTALPFQRANPGHPPAISANQSLERTVNHGNQAVTILRK